ncbi:unnamed protein product [Cylindrotheca closterium]|uniref:Protein KTI12 homolog n=1 Tax=Cylindrotheca closterium TaxID=2856 RepID=A0AAD2CLJ1_9STRA|nr:unnamed protein product [Cylindrotheca closterium]
MPCLIVTGYPSAGKTTICGLLKERALLRQEIEEVQIVNEEFACPDYSKNECYANSLREKQTRAAMKSSFDRAVGITKTQNKPSKSNSKTLIILDSLNYIKGFRYELHCISKAAGEKHAILWVLNSMETVEQWNQSRSKERAYQPALLKELIQRYEPPDDRNRWDKPLYTVDVTPSSTATNATTKPESFETGSNELETKQTTTASSKSEAVQNSVYNMHALEENFADTTTSAAVDSATASLSQPVTKGKKPKKSAFSRARTAASKAAQQSKPKSNNLNTPLIATATKGTSSASESALAGQHPQPPLHQQEERQQQPPPKPLEEQLDDILDNFLLRVQSLKEGHSTRNYIAGDANVLQDLDSISQKVISAINSAQNFYTGGDTLQFQFPSKDSTLSQSFSFSLKGARQRVSLAELRQLRMQYLQWAGTHPPEDTSENGIANAFRLYLEEQLTK